MDIVSKLFLCNLLMILFTMYIDSKISDSLPDVHLKRHIRIISNVWFLFTCSSVIMYIPYFLFVVVD